MGMKHVSALILSSLIPGELSIFHTCTGHYIFFRQLSISFAIFPYGVSFFLFLKKYLFWMQIFGQLWRLKNYFWNGHAF